MTIESDMTLLWFAARVDPVIRDAVGRIDDYIREGYHAPLGMCHWADDCDEPATEWRWFESDLMHYPVCDKHSPETIIWELVAALEALRGQVQFAMERGLVEMLGMDILRDSLDGADTLLARVRGEENQG